MQDLARDCAPILFDWQAKSSGVHPRLVARWGCTLELQKGRDLYLGARASKDADSWNRWHIPPG